MADLELNSFSANINIATGAIEVLDAVGNVLRLSLGECADAKDALSFGVSLLDVAVLPGKVEFNRFSLEFDELASYLVGENGKVSFDKGNFEDLVNMINIALQKATDSMRLKGGPRRGVSSFNVPDPVV